MTASYPEASVRLWDMASGEPRGGLAEDLTGVTGLAFSPDATTLAISRGSGEASLWEAASGRRLGAVRTSTGALLSIAFSGNGLVLATGGFDGFVRYWDVPRVIGAFP